MPNCSVVVCKNRSDLQLKGVTFHRFPKDNNFKEKWINSTGRGPDWWPTKQSTICSDHFEKKHFKPHTKIRRLFDWAMPTLKLRLVFATADTDDTSRNLQSSPARIAKDSEPQTSESSGVEQPSCSSFADSDMEEDHPEQKSEPPSPTTWLEIKQEVLWDGEQSSKEPGAAQAEQGSACGNEAAPPQVGGGERGERSILEELRREMGTVARRDEVSSGLEQIRQEIRELAQGDEFDAFGRYVASLLRNMRPRRASHAQPLLINLLAAEMMKQNDDDLA